MIIEEPIDFPVLRVSQRIGDFYIASINAKTLAKISYSDVRRLVKDQRDLEKFLGIQRPVSPKRIKEIRLYLEGADATFPTSVILAVDERCVDYEELGGSLGQMRLHSYIPEIGTGETEIPIEKIAKVIDGQHRIAAFMDEDGNWSPPEGVEDFDLAVAIFVGADVADQANIFATVNLAQTKVNRSLVYDLTELSHTPSPHKTCHNVAVVLDSEKSSPLLHRIKRLGTATPGRKKEPLTQASFVEALIKFISRNPVADRNLLLEGKRLKRATTDELRKTPFRNLFIDGKELDIAEIVFNYFSAVRNKWPESWAAIGQIGNLLPRANAFKAFMVFLREDAYPHIVEDRYGEVPTVEQFAELLTEVKLKDRDFTTRNFAPGSGGQSVFLRMLRGEIGLEDMLDK